MWNEISANVFISKVSLIQVQSKSDKVVHSASCVYGKN